MDEPERVRERTGVPNATTEKPGQKAEIMEAWMQAVQDHSGEVLDNAYEGDIGLRLKCLSAFEWGQAQTAENPTQEFVNGAEAQAVVALEVKKSSTCNKAPVLTEIVEDKLMDALQVG